LIPFASGADNTNELDTRTNPFQEVGFDGGASKRTYIGPLTRAMAKRMEEERVQKALFFWRINF